jgi:hypothetical protein
MLSTKVCRWKIIISSPFSSLQFYTIDMIITVIVGAVFFPLTLTLGKPFDRYFVERDPSLSYPYL